MTALETSACGGLKIVLEWQSLHQQQGSVPLQGWLQEHKPKTIYITYDYD